MSGEEFENISYALGKNYKITCDHCEYESYAYTLEGAMFIVDCHTGRADHYASIEKIKEAKA